jgi:hypothetical protein
MAARLQDNVEIRSHKGGVLGLQSYNDTFVGADAVSTLMKLQYARTAGEAVRLGNSMISVGLFEHVRDRTQPLKNKATSLYRFAAVARRRRRRHCRCVVLPTWQRAGGVRVRPAQVYRAVVWVRRRGRSSNSGSCNSSVGAAGVAQGDACIR